MEFASTAKAFFEWLEAPTILFVLVVAPLWIVMHYRTRAREGIKLGADEQGALEALTRTAERMETRIDALEKILDADAPRWRERWKDRGS